jgi:hypothetical protein
LKSPLPSTFVFNAGCVYQKRGACIQPARNPEHQNPKGIVVYSPPSRYHSLQPAKTYSPGRQQDLDQIKSDRPIATRRRLQPCRQGIMRPTASANRNDANPPKDRIRTVPNPIVFHRPATIRESAYRKSKRHNKPYLLLSAIPSTPHQYPPQTHATILRGPSTRYVQHL